jgi:hypothetical protein
MKPKETFVEIAETIIVSYIVLIVIFKLVTFPGVKNNPCENTIYEQIITPLLSSIFFKI